jgi:glucokinase
MCVTLGTGVGGGLIIGGEPYRGGDGTAGEIGHTVIAAGGKACGCGSRGCLEAYVKASAIVERTLRYIREGNSSSIGSGDDLTVKDISEAAGRGDEAAVRALARTGWYLGIGLANSVHLIDPDAIAVGGGVSGAGKLILEPALESFREHLMDETLQGVRIVPAELGNKASFIGAAMIALGRLCNQG